VQFGVSLFPMTKLPLLALLLAAALPLAGCPTTDDDDSSPPVSTGPSFAVVATTDFSVGALATVDLETFAVADEITAITGDPVVFADGGLLFQINRHMYDNVRVYDPEQLTTPILEFSTGAGSNPYQAALCDGAIFVIRYDSAELGIYSLDTGLPVGAIDLSAWADSDGYPEMSSMIRRGTTLYVGLERLTRGGSIWPGAPGGGRVLEIDCATRGVTREWTASNNVRVLPHPTDPDALWLLDGVLFNEDKSPALDGGLRELPLDAVAPGTHLLTDTAAGGNLIGIAVGAEGRGILVTADATHNHVHCLDTADWSLTLLSSHLQWVPQVVPDGHGEGWVVFRTAEEPLEHPAGIAVYDLATCEERTTDGWLDFSLEPYSAAFF
jgi:hypothetical protein